MKKIKLSFKSKKLNETPRIALLIHANQRHKMTQLMVSWYQDIQQELQSEVDLSIHIASAPDFEYKTYCTEQNIPFINVKSTTRGEEFNQALQALRTQKFHAVINLWAGDLLTKTLLQAYGQHLAKGGFFSALLDQYLFDPNEFKCMYWPRFDTTQGLDRVCHIGAMISTQLLDGLNWKLWPAQNEMKKGSLHVQMLGRLNKLFKRCPKKSCLLKNMETYGGIALNLKSELGRVLFDDKNWQHYPKLQFADFDSSLEAHTSQDWLDRISDFDERLKLDILVEDTAEEHLWRTHYEFCIYKFLPYADVRLHMITDRADQHADSWTCHSFDDQGSGESWNQALQAIEQTQGDLVLFAGRGGLIDLKTIEHYLIYIFKTGARLLSAQNFFMADVESREIYFWRGTNHANFQNTFGFATCVHRSYLNHLGWQPFNSDFGLNDTSLDRLNELLADPSQRHQRIFFQCATHKLGILSLGILGSMNFKDHIYTGDLQKVDFVNRVPNSCYNKELRDSLAEWTSSHLKTETFDLLPTENSSNQTAPESSFHTQENNPAPISHHSSDQEGSDMSSSAAMSPLERAKALLQQSRQNTSSVAPQATSSDDQPKAALSPLERAKALLKEPELPSSAGAQTTPSTEAQVESTPAVDNKPSAKQAAPIPVNNTTSPELSPLERAKTLLKQSLDAPPKTEQVSEAEKQQDQAAIQNTIQAAEQLVEKLQAVKQSALQQAQAAVSQESNPAADLLCQQGEDAFVAGQVDTARTLFESSLVVQKDSVRAMNNLGVLALQEDQAGSEWQALSYFLLATMHDSEYEGLMQNLNDLCQMYPHLKTIQSMLFEG